MADDMHRDEEVVDAEVRRMIARAWSVAAFSATATTGAQVITTPWAAVSRTVPARRTTIAEREEGAVTIHDGPDRARL